MGEQATVGATGEFNPSRPAEWIGKTVAERYRVDAVVGSGGMGMVFRCHHLGLHKDVALKVLHPQVSQDPEASARFDREAQSASRLNHPNCIEVFDFGTWQPRPGTSGLKYMAMQFLSGCELRELLGAPLPPERVVGLLGQILAALEHAHDRGVVHRDLKPENVFVTRDHEDRELLKLVDFGIAKVFSGTGNTVALTQMGLVFGTPLYMSPEQALGEPVDLRTDIYAAGVVAYQMLAGRPPFMAEDISALLRKQITASPDPLPPSVPSGLAAIITKMLAKKREDRFGSAAEVRDALADASTLAMTFPAVGSDVGSDPTYVLRPPTHSTTQVASLGGEVGAWHRPLALGVGAVAVLVVALAALTGEVPTTTRAVAQPSSPSGLDQAVAAVGRVFHDDLAPDEVMQTLGTPLTELEPEDALQQIDTALVEYPQDGRLHWRRAGVLKQRLDRPKDAARAYATAIQYTPTLLAGADARTQYASLLSDPTVRNTAFEAVLEHGGAPGHPLLVELVNNEMLPLRYDERQRVLAELENEDTVNRKLNLALDLWQASDAKTPCQAFETALRRIEAEPDPYYLGTLHAVSPPKSETDGEAEKKACAGNDALLKTVRGSVLQSHPVPAAQWEGPQAYADEIAKAKRASGRKRRRKIGWRLRRAFGG